MSPRTVRQFRDMREEKRALIMEAGLMHFANYGFHATTISELARAAGISKGLLYHYFSGKEDLLSEIIRQSVSEVNNYLDINLDGRLDENEFEGFVRKLSTVLKENKPFWRLLFQLLLQQEVRESIRDFVSLDYSADSSDAAPGDGRLLSGSLRLILDYFHRKKETQSPDWNPYLEFHMFLLMLIGYAINHTFKDKEDEYDEKTIEAIICRFK